MSIADEPQNGHGFNVCSDTTFGSFGYCGSAQERKWELTGGAQEGHNLTIVELLESLPGSIV